MQEHPDLPLGAEMLGQRRDDRRNALWAERVEVQAEEPVPVGPNRVELAGDAVHGATLMPSALNFRADASPKPLEPPRMTAQ